MSEKLCVANTVTKRVDPIEKTDIRDRRVGAELTNGQGQRVRVFASEDVAKAWIMLIQDTGARTHSVDCW